MQFKKHIITAFALLSLTSCFKEDKAIILPDTESEVRTVYMGDNYENQMFFNLEDLTYKNSNLYDWDLSFDNITNQFRIVTNYGRNVFIHRTNEFYLTELRKTNISTLGIKDWLYDFPSGYIDSNAFGDWRTLYNDKMPFHIIDLGRDIKDVKERYYFFRVSDFNIDKYTVVLGKFYNDNQIDTVEIPRDKNRNYTYFNIAKAEIYEEFEPLKEDWDFIFSRYRFIFYGVDPKPLDPFPYLVTGVLLNPNGVEIALDSTKGFNNIGLEYSKTLDFSNKQDIIGYAWKNFDYNVTFTYTINPNMVYIVRNKKNAYYKIRFLDFLNEDKKTGYPKFEVQRIAK